MPYAKQTALLDILLGETVIKFMIECYALIKNNQSLPLSLAIFDETTISAADNYFPDTKNLFGFLIIINTW